MTKPEMPERDARAQIRREAVEELASKLHVLVEVWPSPYFSESTVCVVRLDELNDACVSFVDSERGCSWWSNDDGVWTSACGAEFEFTDNDGPRSNGMTYCFRCGAVLCQEVPSDE